MTVELKKVRSYREEVISRLFDIVQTDARFSIEFMGAVDRRVGFTKYPLFYVTIGDDKNPNLKDVLISAGIHGEEPAGVYTLLKFLEADACSFIDKYRFLIFPCINPFGFEHGYRFNHDGVDINRKFKKDSLCCAINRVMEVLEIKARKFMCTIDLHETDPGFVGEGFTCEDNPKEFYMWEVCPDKNLRIGDKVIESVERFVSVCKQDRIYDDINSGGVIWYPEGCGNPVYAGGTTLEGFLAHNYTPQAFTLETPCGWSMQQRIFAHRTALRTILELKQNA